MSDKYCYYDIGPEHDGDHRPGMPKKRLKGRVVRENALTVIVALPTGDEIKRHKTKHNVEFI
jgi:hypothetical protein